MTKLFLMLGAMFVNVALAIAQGVPASPDLDTRFLPRPIPVEEPPSRGPVVGEGPSMPRRDKPVAIRLLRVEPQTCNWDDAVIYDVEIRNVSKEPLMLPSTLIPPLVALPKQPPTVFPLLILSLGIGARGLDGHLGRGETLYGDPTDSFSMRPLPPGAATVIRAETRCLPISSSLNAALFDGGAATVPIVARARLTRSQSEGGVSIISNEVKVTVTKPPPQ